MVLHVVAFSTVSVNAQADDAGSSTAAKQDSPHHKVSSHAHDANTKFVDPNLKVEDWKGKFESESREIFTARGAIVEALNLKNGARVADIGAGTGFFTELLAKAVGKDGWVYALDISPKFIDYIYERMRKGGLENVTAMVSTEQSLDLPLASVDAAFVCDTYHHFEKPEKMLGSIHQSLKPGGTLVIIDFDRVPGKSRQWVLDHVTQGKEDVVKTVEKSGFKFDKEAKVDGLSENFMLLFTRD